VRITGPLHDLHFLGAKPDQHPTLFDGKQNTQHASRDSGKPAGGRVRRHQPVSRKNRLDTLADKPISYRPDIVLRWKGAGHQKFFAAKDGKAVALDQPGQVVGVISYFLFERTVAREQCHRIVLRPSKTQSLSIGIAFLPALDLPRQIACQRAAGSTDVVGDRSRRYVMAGD
jgi:hypothetical protein